MEDWTSICFTHCRLGYSPKSETFNVIEEVKNILNQWRKYYVDGLMQDWGMPGPPAWELPQSYKWEIVTHKNGLLGCCGPMCVCCGFFFCSLIHFDYHILWCPAWLLHWLWGSNLKHPSKIWVISLWPGDAILRHRSGSTLAQVMACWQAITWTNVDPLFVLFLWHLSENHFTANNLYNQFES